jgi:hypothetical protein
MPATFDDFLLQQVRDDVEIILQRTEQSERLKELKWCWQNFGMI